MSKRQYSDEEFREAMESSYSIREALEKLSLKPTGGNYKVAKRRINLLSIDISHHTGQAHLKGKTHTWAIKTPTEKILVENSTYGGSTFSLKNRLISENYFERKCYSCGNTEWLGKSIPLELEHKNGNKFDNRIENLTLLCPNCHALTSTYRGKNKKRVSKETLKERRRKECINCREKTAHISSKSGLCRKCWNKSQQKTNRPSLEQLQQEIEELGFLAVGKKYGVSDNAIRKWIKKYMQE